MYVQTSHLSGTVEPEAHVRFLPIMITRLMLSLREASALQAQQGVWSFGGPTVPTNLRFDGSRGLGATRNEIALGTVAGRYKESRSGR